MVKDDVFAEEVAEAIDGVFDDDVSEVILSCSALPALVNKLRGLTGGNAGLASGYLGEVHVILSDDSGLKNWLVERAAVPAAWVASRVG